VAREKFDCLLVPSLAFVIVTLDRTSPCIEDVMSVSVFTDPAMDRVSWVVRRLMFDASFFVCAQESRDPEFEVMVIESGKHSCVSGLALEAALLRYQKGY
jgi:hypothetical protein